MTNRKDKYRHFRNSKYICNECGTPFTYWLVRDDDWATSGFDWKAVGKPCFEKRVPNPHYMTFEEYDQEDLTKEGKHLTYTNLEKNNRTYDNLQRKRLRRLGIKNLKNIRTNDPIKRVKPTTQAWECEYCHAELTTPLGVIPPEICQKCGR